MGAAVAYAPRARRVPKNVSEVLLSERTAPRIDVLYAVVTARDGVEGIARRETDIGLVPFLTDDPNLVERMLELARQAAPDDPTLTVATFARAVSAREVNRPRRGPELDR